MRFRGVARSTAVRVSVPWALLGLVSGAAVAALVHLERAPSIVYHGRYVSMNGGSLSSAYSSTLSLTLDPVHRSAAPAIVLGVLIGLLAGLLIGLALAVRGVSPAWPSAAVRR